MKFTNRKENKAKKFLVYILILLVIGSGAFVFFSPIFEKNAPKISIKDEIYWNLNTPLELNLSDDTEIKSFEVTYKDNANEIKLDTKTINKSNGNIELNILAPKFESNYIPNEATLKIFVNDTSKWNFFQGNENVKIVKVKIDKKNPTANVLTNSYAIRRGGSAVVVVEVKDENLKDKYISFNGEEKFELIPFYKDNFYMAVIAWPIDIVEFKRVNLVATDYADNKTVTKVPLYIRDLQGKIDDLKISDEFIDKVSKNVLEKSSMNIPASQEEVFVKTNRDLRAKNVKTIKDETRKNMSTQKVDKFVLDTFKRLPASMTFAGFGERRNYFYDGKKIDEAWHLGNDWASVKKAKIFTANSGKVIFNDYLGIYGNTIIIDHGYGISSLYAHTSRSNVMLNDFVKANEQIANTGATGAVFGDHLHFGVLIQGIEVNPKEWLSKQWINENIKNITENAMKVIDSK